MRHSDAYTYYQRAFMSCAKFIVTFGARPLIQRVSAGASRSPFCLERSKTFVLLARKRIIIKCTKSLAEGFALVDRVLRVRQGTSIFGVVMSEWSKRTRLVI